MPKSKPNICPYPFSRLVAGKSHFIPCCRDWLKEDFFSGQQNTLDVWNSTGAQELRKRILKGDYSLCRRDICGQPRGTMEELRANPHLISEAPLSEEVLQEMVNLKTELASGPTSISISADERCNLACPSCRSHHITDLSDESRAEIVATEILLAKSAKNLKVIRLASNGEAFFSPWLRDLIRHVDRKNYPQLEYLYLLSNGVFLNEKNFSELRPGSEWIRRMMITVDAGSPEVYREVRGGPWKVLVKNLEWLGQERARGRFDEVIVQMVVQQKNFRDIPKLATLRAGWGLDYLNLYGIYDWKTELNYTQAAVHRAGHPQHQELRQVLAEVKNDPKVVLSPELRKLVS